MHCLTPAEDLSQDFFNLWEEEFLEGEMQNRAGMSVWSRAQPVLWGAGLAAALKRLLRSLALRD